MKYEKNAEQSEWRQEKSDIMKFAMDEWEKDSGFGRATLIVNAVKDRMGGHRMDDKQKRRFEEFKKDFYIMRTYKDNQNVQRFYHTSSNDEKLLHMEKMTESELKDLWDNGLISKELRKKFKNKNTD